MGVIVVAVSGAYIESRDVTISTKNTFKKWMIFPRYTSQEPDSLKSLVDVEVTGKGRSFNCSRNCHHPRWLIDAGTGVIDRKGCKYALACGETFVRIVEAPKVATVFTVTATLLGGPNATVLLMPASGDPLPCILVPKLQPQTTMHHKSLIKPFGLQSDLPSAVVEVYVL